MKFVIPHKSTPSHLCCWYLGIERCGWIRYVAGGIESRYRYSNVFSTTTSPGGKFPHRAIERWIHFYDSTLTHMHSSENQFQIGWNRRLSNSDRVQSKSEKTMNALNRYTTQTLIPFNPYLLQFRPVPIQRWAPRIQCRTGSKISHSGSDLAPIGYGWVLRELCNSW